MNERRKYETSSKSKIAAHNQNTGSISASTFLTTRTQNSSKNTATFGKNHGTITAVSGRSGIDSLFQTPN